MHDLTETQHAALTALLSGKTVPEAAEAAGVNQTTVRRWLRKDEAFSEALAAGRREALSNAMNLVTLAARTAAGVVLEVMRSPKTPPAVRLRAATGVLEMLLKWAELQDFEARLRKLEGGTADADESA